MLPRVDPQPAGTVIITSLGDLTKAQDEHGPLISVGLAWRITDTATGYFYRLVEEGRFKKFVVHGLMHVAVRELQEWTDRRKAA